MHTRSHGKNNQNLPIQCCHDFYFHGHLRILRRNPLRAGLTMLGIIIGIGAVVAMVSLGQGATASVQAEIASLGTNVLFIVPGGWLWMSPSWPRRSIRK